MKKHVFITNGTGGCGKDTFANFVRGLVPTMKISSIDCVKDVAYRCGWNDDKSEKGRKFLSDLKLLTSEYSDMPFKDIIREAGKFYTDSRPKVLLIDIREPAEIERAKIAFNAKTILIRSDRVGAITSNMADANVENYEYDYIIENNGSLEEFKKTVETFVRKEIIEKEND